MWSFTKVTANYFVTFIFSHLWHLFQIAWWCYLFLSLLEFVSKPMAIPSKTLPFNLHKLVMTNWCPTPRKWSYSFSYEGTTFYILTIYTYTLSNLKNLGGQISEEKKKEKISLILYNFLNVQQFLSLVWYWFVLPPILLISCLINQRAYPSLKIFYWEEGNRNLT